MKNAIEICENLITESIKVGRQEMAIRRTNSGIAGSIANKIGTRAQFLEVEGEMVQLSITQQAVLLSERLTADEIEYAQNW